MRFLFVQHLMRFYLMQSMSRGTSIFSLYRVFFYALCSTVYVRSFSILCLYIVMPFIEIKIVYS